LRADYHPPRPDETYTGPKTSPQTDPTNPCRQESVGIWERAEEASVRKVDEPGLMDRDRDLRAI
jgi:hypothetical protein